MTVPNSLPVKFSDVIAEFGGSNPPRNLSAYRAGGGYTPSGAKGGSAAIPTPGGLISSSYAVNLGSFPGAQKSLSITQFWPYKDYFHRTLYNHSSNPPATDAQNDDCTRHWNDFGYAGRVGNGWLWQRKNFSNENNSGLPDSATCTVFFMLTGSWTTYTSTMSGGTSLSARGRDAVGEVMHMTPIATGRYNFQTNNSGSEIAMAYATYNCSIKKISEIFTAMNDGGGNGVWDELIILPGNRTVGEQAVTRDENGSDNRLGAPINPNEVVIGLRYDGAGDYEQQYYNHTFPDPIRFSGWWGNNGAISIEANTTENSTWLTTQVRWDRSPACVWAKIVPYEGAVYSPGVNPVWPYLNISANTNSFTVKRNGGITATMYGTAVDIPAYQTCPENWYIGNPMSSMPGDRYWVRVTPQPGYETAFAGNLSGPRGYVPLSSDQTWEFTGGVPLQVDVNIADNPAGTNAAYLGAVVLRTGSSGGGGGGGGGGSVSVSAYMPGHSFDVRARDMRPGHSLELLNLTRDGVMAGEVISNRVSEQNLLTMVSASGIELTCSDNTPLTLEDGSCINSTEVLNKRLPVQDENGFRWEEIVELRDAGRGMVATIFCDNQCYAAGDSPGRYIWTHNAGPTNSKE